MYDVVEMVFGLLKLHNHGAHDVVNVHGMSVEYNCGGFDLHVCVEVDVVGECGKLHVV